MSRVRNLLIITLSLLALCVGPACAVDAALSAFAGKRVLILGDSITQDGTWVSFLT